MKGRDMDASRLLPETPRAALTPVAARLLAELRRVGRDPADADAVHDARVAGRRLFAGTELWLEPGKAQEKLRARVERCVKRLGRVRNLDVAAEFLREGPAGDAAARKALARRFRRKAVVERARLGEWLGPGRIKRLKVALARVLAGAREDARAPAKSSLGPRLRRVLSLARTGRAMDDPARAHELRREIRVLRYQQESIAALYPAAQAASLAGLFVRLQDAAGEWHDRFVIDRAAARLEKKPKFRGKVGVLRARLAAEMKERAAAFESSLAELVGLKDVLAGKGRRGSR